MISNYVSIIVPVYNAEKYLEDCLESLTRQSMAGFEVLLVDDGSTDGSLSICRSYVKRDSRFRLFEQKNSGAAAARNRALDEASGEWITFVDSDDYLEIDSIERLVSTLVSSGADIALGGYGSIREGANSIKFVTPDIEKPLIAPVEALSKILYQDGLDFAPWGKLFRSKLFEDVRFPPLRSSEDLATIYKPFLKAQAVSLIRDSGYRYRLVSGSLSYSNFESEAWQVMFNVSQDICASFPELRSPCDCRRLSFAFHVFLISDNPVVREKTWEEILATRRAVLTDSAARKKARVAAIISFFGRRITGIVGSLLHYSR